MPLHRLVLARRGVAAAASTALPKHARPVAVRGAGASRAQLELQQPPPARWQQSRAYGATALRAKEVTFTWRVQGEDVEVVAEEGKTLLEVAHENDIELEGACGGELACSTCHVVFEPALFDQLPPKKEEEEDMLDLAWGLTDTSRLGCQIKVTPLLEGALVTIPEETNNMLGDAPPTGSGK